MMTLSVEERTMEAADLFPGWRPIIRRPGPREPWPDNYRNLADGTELFRQGNSWLVVHPLTIRPATKGGYDLVRFQSHAGQTWVYDIYGWYETVEEAIIALESLDGMGRPRLNEWECDPCGGEIDDD